MSRILILDDDPHILRSLEIMLQRDGHKVWGVPDAESALEFLEREPVDIALVDLQLPGMSGLDFLRELRTLGSDVDAIVITAHGSIESAVDAMKEGAFDYLTKPFSPEQVRHRISQAERIRGYRTEVSGLRRILGDAAHMAEFAGQNPAVRKLLVQAKTVAETDVSILITGESGTGKSLLAKQIHKWSARSDGPFAVIDCTSFQETLFESELFGHKRGAFTGAVADKPGKAEAARNGTLFFDEIGEIPLPMQGKLLRLIEDKAYERLGDPTPREIDARIVAATNRDILEMVEEKEFRKDLYYRLGIVELSIPPLRQRGGDILLLAERFLNEFNMAHNKEIKEFDGDVKRFFLKHMWPGNVRELANLVERATLICEGPLVQMEHLPKRLLPCGPKDDLQADIVPIAVMEENLIRRALALGLSMDEAARLLGIDPATLWRKRKKLDL